MPGYRDLKVWQSAMLLAEEAYRLGRSFPKHEVYGLTSQLQRSAVSIPSNIAEGSERKSIPDFKRFLTTSQGPAAELRTQVYISWQVGVLSDSVAEELVQELKSISKMLQALHNSLKRPEP